jgi:hypothetical protein
MNILLLLVAFILGAGTSLTFVYLLSKRVDTKLKQKVNDIFQEVLDNLKEDFVKFECRLNNMVQLSTSLDTLDSVGIVYIIDRHEISIFKESECIYTSSNLDSKIKENIVSQIWSKFSNQINDTVQVYDLTYDCNTFLKVSQVQKVDLQEEEFDKQPIFDLDDILDRINEIGFENLDDAEKEFLKKYKP